MLSINDYKLQEPPFQGGMALVYKGEKGVFSRAFKMVRPDKAANNPRLLTRFLEEIKLQARLEHPNIIKILDAYPFQDNNGATVTVLEMEWLDGMDLERYVEKYSPDGLDNDTVMKIARQIVDGLEYAHRQSVLHLDIKPSNIFRTNDGYIKIIDFGIARVVGENADIVEDATRYTILTETGESTFRGTLAYASPEQQVGAKLGFTSDIYSFGKTLHFLCTGSTDPSSEIRDSLLNEVVSKCTAQNPNHRFQTFEEVREALSASAPVVKCPKCGAVVGKNSKFCSECGSPMQVKPQPQSEKCPKCGKMRKGKSPYCDNCGWDFGQKHQKTLTGFNCRCCKKTTRAYSDGKVNFCNHCGAPKDNLIPVYK